MWNRSEKSLEAFGAPGPRRAGSIAEAVREAEAVVTMLADDAAVESVVQGGLLDALAEDAVHVGMSTVGIDTARRLTEAHRRRDRAYVAAPVFGRPDVRASGEAVDRAGRSGGGACSCPPAVRCNGSPGLRIWR